MSRRRPRLHNVHRAEASVGEGRLQFTMSYVKNDEGLVIKETKAVVVQMNYNNSEYGNFDDDNPLTNDTKVRLLLIEVDEKTGKHKAGTAIYTDVTLEVAKTIHLGDVMVSSILIPGREE